MINFRLGCLEIRIVSDKGLFGQKVKFKPGLNLIRAENTSGKSTLVNSIYYALGFESLLSNRKGSATLKPVLKRVGTYEGVDFNVLESTVFLEITSKSGKTITVNRQIVGETDQDLVRVVDGPLLTQPGETYSVDFYYLNREGSAQREKGFHKFLSDFLQLDIPYVSRYQGGDVPLYLQCIIPLMFIEQIRGWSGIQAGTPKVFGIQNVTNSAIEYLLDLDVQKNKLLRERLGREKSQIFQEWSIQNDQLKSIAKSIGGTVQNLHDQPKAEFLSSDIPKLKLIREEKTLELDSYLVSLREKLALIKSDATIVRPEAEKVQVLMESLGQRESQRILILAKIRQISQEISNIDMDNQMSSESASRIDADIKKHFDLKRILDLGGPLELSLADHKCPTCKQEVADSLIPDIRPPMSIEDNITFLREQKNALTVVERQNISVLENLRLQSDEYSEILRTNVESIRSIKNDLYRNSETSEANLREQILVDSQIRALERQREEFSEWCQKLKPLADRYASYLADAAKLPESFFSKEDLKKLDLLKTTFNELIQRFGYRSTSTGDIEISKDNYLPICSIEGFELALDASASDNIRIIWAYTIALLRLGSEIDTNHWGVVIFDEPEQQKMKEASSIELYRSVAKINPEHAQVIVATSEETGSLVEKVAGFNVNLIDLQDIVIRPFERWHENLTSSSP